MKIIGDNYILVSVKSEISGACITSLNLYSDLLVRNMWIRKVNNKTIHKIFVHNDNN